MKTKLNSKEKGGASQEAAEAMEIVAIILRDEVVIALQGRTLTSDEIAAAISQSPLAVRPRLSELFRLGIVVKTHERRRNISGKTATVWALARGLSK